jgi:hypothetical protein
MDALPDRSTPTELQHAFDSLVAAARYLNQSDGEEERSIEAGWMLQGILTRDLFTALARVRREMCSINHPHHDPTYSTARLLVAELTYGDSDEHCLQEFAAFADAYDTTNDDGDNVVAAIAHETLAPRAKQWTNSTMGSQYLGLLTKDAYEALGLQRLMSRPYYLRSQVRTEQSLTSAEARNVALTLTNEWVGTLDGLLETARSLCTATPRA